MPGRNETFLKDCFEHSALRNMGIETYAWAEDLDLSGGAGALAAMKGSVYDGLYAGLDDIRTRKGFGTPYLLGIMGIDESGGGSGGYLKVDGRTRAIRFGKLSQTADNEYWLMSFLDNPIALPEGNKISCYGNASGAGAEQHAVIIVVAYPDLERHPMMKPNSIEGPFGLKTGTRIADTFGPKTSDLLGDNLDFEDSEESLSQDPDLRYCLHGLVNGPGLADTSVVGIRYQRMAGGIPDLELYVPASMAGSEVYWEWPEIEFKPENPPKLAAHGKSTTSDEYTLHIGTSAPYGDLDYSKQTSRGSGGSARSVRTTGRTLTSRTIDRSALTGGNYRRL